MMSVERIELWLATQEPDDHVAYEIAQQAKLVACAQKEMPSEPPVLQVWRNDPKTFERTYQQVLVYIEKLVAHAFALAGKADQWYEEAMRLGGLNAKNVGLLKKAEAGLATARREERERCAKVCEELAYDIAQTEGAQSVIKYSRAETCARHIRALREEGK